jgi:hypothetical protein
MNAKTVFKTILRSSNSSRRDIVIKNKNNIVIVWVAIIVHIISYKIISLDWDTYAYQRQQS